MKKRIIFFGDSNSYITTILYKKFFENLGDKFELVAVVNTAPKNNLIYLKNVATYLTKKLFNPFDKSIAFNRYGSFVDFIKSDVNIMNTENVNDNLFIKKIKKLKPNYAFLMGCPQIFKSDMIDCFEKVVNYHNSYLPAYRGLEATSWAMTHGEKYTGYTFHYINEKVDDGKIIFQEKIGIDYSKISYENELIKTKKAAKSISQVFDLVAHNFEGAEQIGKASYYGSKQKKELLTFNKFDNIKMIQKLTGIWGGVYLLSNNETIFVTKVTDDGKVKRIKWLPPKVYAIFKIFKSLLSNNRECYKKS